MPMVRQPKRVEAAGGTLLYPVPLIFSLRNRLGGDWIFYTELGKSRCH